MTTKSKVNIIKTLMEAWAEVNEMLEDSFIENNDEWYLYVIAG